jgi:hypothetical protein
MAASATTSSSKQNTSDGSSADSGAWMKVAGATAAAVAGGVLLKRRLAPKRHRVLGVPLPPVRLDGLIPSDGLDLKRIGKQVNKAGKRAVTASHQLSKLSDDVERVGKTAQKLGDSLS